MDEKPTVQMDPYAEEEPRGRESESSSTVPIDDMFQTPDWPPPAQEPTPQMPGPPPPPPPPSSRPGGGGATVIMAPEATTDLLAWLAVAEGPGAARGRVFSLERETVIGRKRGQILLAGDSYVSGEHAKVRLESSDDEEKKQSFVLYDLASANGTFAGDRDSYRDNQVYRHELSDSDFILIGDTTLVFKQVDLSD